MLVRIEITCETAAFDDFPATELGRILRGLAGRIERDGSTQETLYDINGNAVGVFTTTD